VPLRNYSLPRCASVQIYHASEEYGIEDIRTSGGYFLLGKVFHELSKDDVAEAMFDRVCCLVCIITYRTVVIVSPCLIYLGRKSEFNVS